MTEQTTVTCDTCQATLGDRSGTSYWKLQFPETINTGSDYIALYETKSLDFCNGACLSSWMLAHADEMVDDKRGPIGATDESG